MRRIRTIALLLIPMLALGAFALALSGLLPYKIYAVQTGSMSPTIPSTSAVIVKPDVYRVGQPISFYEKGMVITHRLVAINSDGTIDTKGDANATIDPWHVSTKAIIGEVVAAPAHLGYWLIYLKNPAGLLSLLIAGLLCWQIWSFVGGEQQPSAHHVRHLHHPRTLTGRRARSQQTA